MTSLKLPAATYVQTSTDLYQVIESLIDEPVIAIDTESNSLHAYRERVCLIQISSPTADYILDPLSIDDMQPLGMLFEAPTIEKVFHAAEYDVTCMKRDFSFEIRSLFDTMIAARICGYRQVGLNNLLLLHFGIEMDKSHQRDNWGERPLPQDSLHYAQMDTHYLLSLRDVLHRELQDRGHLDEALETFYEMSIAIPPHDGRIFDPEGYWKIGLPNHLSITEMGVLRELYILREEIARELDMPPFRVIGNPGLLEAARRMPQTPRDLARLNNVPPAQVRRYGEEILEAVQRGRQAMLPRPPHYRPPPAIISDRYTVLHSWRKERAMMRGVESDIIISRQALWDLAEKAPTTMEEMQNIEGLGPWRLQTYGEELLQVIARYESDGKYESDSKSEE
ncbi:MAG TPA: HRDC domain-containing protein [Phototrophicaceae bacterium]|jgi:ribonuclease D|nr:HRDC domain-containing protein [Phototrophicaceae bacterium]